jgi:tetratricopeptide (TPR) repeat protein
VTLGIVGYFWWQLQPKSNFPSSGVPVRPATPVAPTASVATNTAPSLAGAPVSPSGQPIQAPAVGQTVPSNTPLPSLAANGPVATTGKNKRADAAAENETDDGVRLVRVTKSPLQINPALTKGFDSFNRGNFATAKVEYESVLKAEPQNLEALHGLAAIAVREGRWEVADHFYERILVADPKDAAAMSAMINLHGQNNPVAAESRLKGIVSEQPESAAAQFALGNLYAGQQRWADAQQAYFKAYSADAENPDTLYNLAVSLEHMNQTKLAHQYYSLALEAAKRRPAGFDLAVAGARAAALRP